MKRVRRNNKRNKPHMDINIDWKQIIHNNFKTILVSVLFIIVLLILVFMPDIEENVQAILIATLGSFVGFIIGKELG